MCEQLVKDIRDEIVFSAESGWKLQCMCQKRDYGCRLVFQLFNKKGQNMKAQMLLRVEHISEHGQVHEFLRGVRNYLGRHASLLAKDVEGILDYSNDTVTGDSPETQDTVYDCSQFSQAVEETQ